MGAAIPINLVEKRRKHLLSNNLNEHKIYPLYKTYNEIYNYENIKDSISKWAFYSESMGQNLSKLMELYSLVSTKGTQSQIREITNFLKEEISYIDSPYVLKKQLSIISENNEYAKEIINSIVENSECDRLLKNYNAISKRFNIDKFMRNNIIYEDGIVDGIYGLCSLIDTYNIDIPSRFCISSELALYSFDKINRGSVQPNVILENVIDYYLVNYGVNDLNSFFNEMEKSCKKDMFIQEDGIAYLQYLKNINKNFTLNEDGSYEFNCEENKNNDYENEPLFYLDLMLKYNDNCYNTNESNSLLPINEFSISDTIKNIVTKIKLAPVKSISLFKAGIRAIFVTTRLQDIAKGTRNALALCFYGFVVISAFTLSLAIGLLAFIVTFILSRCVDKSYLKEAITEWKEHKYSIERKIKECNDPEKKRKLEAYLSKVEAGIDKLEKKYNEIRDKTVDEIDDNIKEKSNSLGSRIREKMSFSSNRLLDPDGNEINLGTFNNKDDDNTKKKIYSPVNSTENDDLEEYERYMRERNKK